MIVGLDNEGKVQVFNKVAEKIIGYTKKELEGRNWFEVVVPRNRYPQVWREFKRLMKGNLPKRFYNPILTKSGEERYIIWQSNQVLEQGQIVGVISFGVDALEQIFIENQNIETKGESVLQAIIEKVISQAVTGVFANVIPPQYQDSNIINEIGILNRAAIGINKRPWKNVFVVGEALSQNDMTTHEIAQKLNCDRTTAYRIIDRLKRYGFVEKKGARYTLSNKNCPLLYYLCRKRQDLKNRLDVAI